MHTLQKCKITALNFSKSLLNTARPNIFIVRVNCYSYYMWGNIYESFKNFFFCPCILQVIQKHTP